LYRYSPALENVAAALRLPEDVAGATLLSFGNGAPDVFAQIAALSQASSEGISLAIGAVLGAGLFVSSAVFPIVVLVSPPSAAHRHNDGGGGGGGSSGGFPNVLDDDDGYGGSGGVFAASAPVGHLSRVAPGIAAVLARGGVEVEKIPFGGAVQVAFSLPTV
jgi:sodium/potassium/calcium exchanger 6